MVYKKNMISLTNQILEQLKEPLALIVPIFNEGCSIIKFLHKIKNLVNLQIVFVDDDSKDDTKKIIKSFIEKNQTKYNIILLENDENIGMFQTIKKGLSYSVEYLNSELFIVMQLDSTEILFKIYSLIYPIIHLSKDFIVGPEDTIIL